MSEIEQRPRVRADCENGPRPCPWVSCRWHLLDLRELGNGRLEMPGLILAAGADAAAVDAFTDRAAETVVDMPETCSLDLAARAELDSAEIAVALRISRARVGQIERGLVPILRRRAIAAGIR